jgi:hypothetical protein
MGICILYVGFHSGEDSYCHLLALDTVQSGMYIPGSQWNIEPPSFFYPVDGGSMFL